MNPITSSISGGAKQEMIHKLTSDNILLSQKLMMDKDRDKDELIEDIQQKIQTKMASRSKCENNIHWKDGAIADLVNKSTIAKVELNST